MVVFRGRGRTESAVLFKEAIKVKDRLVDHGLHVFVVFQAKGECLKGKGDLQEKVIGPFIRFKAILLAVGLDGPLGSCVHPLTVGGTALQMISGQGIATLAKIFDDPR